MTTKRPINRSTEVAAIMAAHQERRDPAYEWGVLRTVPSRQPAHAGRVPHVRKVASEWRPS